MVIKIPEFKTCKKLKQLSLAYDDHPSYFKFMQIHILCMDYNNHLRKSVERITNTGSKTQRPETNFLTHNNQWNR